jgi:hypothetical protein
MHLAADRVADIVLDDPVDPAGPLPRRVDRVLDRGTDVVQWRPHRERRGPGPQ